MNSVQLRACHLIVFTLLALLPTVVSGQSVFWFDGQDPNADRSAGDSSTNVWRDKSPLRNDAIRLDLEGIEVPEFNSTLFGGRGGFKFNGSQAFESNFNFGGVFTPGQDYTAFTVFQTTQGGRASFWADRPGEGPTHGTGVFNGKARVRGYGGISADSVSAFNNGQTHIASYGFSGGTSSFTVNGINQSTVPTNGGVNQQSKLTIGALVLTDKSVRDPFVGNLGEIVVVGGSLTSQDRHDVNTYLGERWGTQVPQGGSTQRGELVIKGYASGSSNNRNYSIPQNQINRLARWNGTGWDDASTFDLSTGNVHVLTHGWAPGQRDWVEDNPDASAWDNEEWFGNFTKLATKMENRYSNDLDLSGQTRHIVAYSWIDESATNNAFNKGEFASQSRAHTDGAGTRLASLLMDAGIQSDSNQLHLVGHSHGARVSAVAFAELERRGVGVEHLTIFDSPEIRAFENYGANNNLRSILAGQILGKNLKNGETFVDNYVSSYGKRYGIDGIVDVELRPNKHGVSSPFGTLEHSYPLDWYARALPNRQI